MRKKLFQGTLIIATLLIFAGNFAMAENCHTFTINADFDKGALLNVNHDDPDQLQLNKETKPFPFINVAASGRGTVIRINTQTGQIIGEYWSAPNGRGKNPSRTTVDLYGNVWVGNRDEKAGGKGSVVKIGLVIGGTRCNKDGTLNPVGQYLKPPFEYNTCIDRDGDGLIKTSRGLADIRPWANTNGVDNNGSVSTADDEAILLYVRTNGLGVRHLSVDANNNVWVGGYSNNYFDLLNGDTGAIMATFNKKLGPYGGLVDSNGILWSSIRASNGLMRYDLKGTPSDTKDDTYKFLPTKDSYGMGIDTYGNIWLAQAYAKSIYKFYPDGTVYSGFPKNVSGVARGVAVTPKNNNVWVALSHGSNKVVRLDNNGNILKAISVGKTPTGVAVDADGKVWVTNYDSHNLMRINPDGGTDGKGAVDLTVSLGNGAYPYNYSDMTGIVVLGTILQGSWTVIHESADGLGTEWTKISWTSHEINGTEVKIEVRASDTQSGLAGKDWTAVSNGGELSSVIGKYIEVRANLTKDSGTKESPVLYDLSVYSESCEPPQLITVQMSAPLCSDESITVSGKATDKIGVKTVLVNGNPAMLISTDNPTDLNEVSFSTAVNVAVGVNTVEVVATSLADKSVSEKRTVLRETCCEPPVITIQSPEPGYITCDDSIVVSGTVTDKKGIKSVLVNGNSVTLEPTGKPDNEVFFITKVTLEYLYTALPIEVVATSSCDDKTDSKATNVTRFATGVYRADETGIVYIDWLYDGGAYRGEMGIFSLTGMDIFKLNSPEFFKEAARRAMSNTEEGYVIISDRTESARFNGSLGEPQDWNNGEYKGLKTFMMKPGDPFATILVPDYTLKQLYDDPETTDVRKRPLFSLATYNPDDEMYVGQIADVNGMGKAFIYEDMNFVKSDKDYNDFIFQITGVVICEGKTPTLDSLIKDGIMKADKDWRVSTDLGKQLIEHIEYPPVKDDTLWMSVNAGSCANLTVYDPLGKFIGKEGSCIPGATFKSDEKGQSVKLPSLESGNYRIVLQPAGKGGVCDIEVKGFEGNSEVSTMKIPFEIAPHQTLVTSVSAEDFLETQSVDFKTPAVPVSADGKPLVYDFDGDGDTDVADIMKIAGKWDTKTGDEKYDVFYDFDDDGYIRLTDIMKVVNSADSN